MGLGRIREYFAEGYMLKWLIATVCVFVIPTPPGVDSLELVVQGIQTPTDTIWLPADTVWIAGDTTWLAADTVWVPSDTVFIQPPPDTVQLPDVELPSDTVFIQLPPDTVWLGDSVPVEPPIDPPVDPPTPSEGRVLSYGFEDWGGSIASTPNYPFATSYQEYADRHEAASSVVTSYSGLSPHSGSYFWLLQHGPGTMSPSVSGISTHAINPHTNIGLGSGRVGGQNPFDISSITNGEIFVRFYIATSSYGSGLGSNVSLKLVRLTGAGDEVLWYQRQGGGVDPQLALTKTGEAQYLNTINVPDWDDWDWHRCSLYANYDTGEIAAWYDVENETLGNATQRDNFGAGTFGNVTDVLVIINNWSSYNPSGLVYHALDDIEIWDGLPENKE